MKNKWFLVGLVLVLAVWWAGLSAYPLLESTEGRYASVAWEMAHGGGWIEPDFNGNLLFSKPPLAYWAGASSLFLLPDTEWSVRLPATLMLVVCFLLTRRLGMLAGLTSNRAYWAGGISVLSPLAFVQGHMTTGDIFLWTGVLLSLCCLFDDRPDGGFRSVLLGLGLAVGFMAKGHMVLFWIVLPALAWIPFSREGSRRLVRLVHPLTLAVFLGLSVPWFAAVLHRHPDLLGYWLGAETADRFLTTSHGRGEPWWYFLPQVPVLVLPWLGEWWRGMRRVWTGAGPNRIWLAWIVVPLLIFTLSGSKRPNYLLPMVTPMALVAAAGIPEISGAGLRRRTGGWLLLLLAAPFAVHFFGGAPATRTLVRAAAETGQPLAAYWTDPSGLVFYHRGPVPVIGKKNPDPVTRLADEGYVFLVREDQIPDLEREMKRESKTIIVRKGMAIVQSIPKVGVSQAPGTSLAAATMPTGTLGARLSIE